MCTSYLGRHNKLTGSTVSVNNAFRKLASDDIIIVIVAVNQTYYINYQYNNTYLHKNIYLYTLQEYQCIIHKWQAHTNILCAIVFFRVSTSLAVYYVIYASRYDIRDTYRIRVCRIHLLLLLWRERARNHSKITATGLQYYLLYVW